MMDLTIESLARAIHEDAIKACKKVTGRCSYSSHKAKLPSDNFDELSDEHKAIRREQARLMMERIMR